MAASPDKAVMLLWYYSTPPPLQGEPYYNLYTAT